MTTDILLSIPDLFLTMGLPSIDESLDKLLVAMESFPKAAILGDTVGYARVLGLLLALCVGSYECWLMMLGRRAMDVMKLARIIALSMCITSSGWICSELQGTRQSSGGYHQGNGQGQEQGGCRHGTQGCPKTG